MATPKPVTIKDGHLVMKVPYTEHVTRPDGSQTVRYELDGKKQSVTWGTPAVAEAPAA